MSTEKDAMALAVLLRAAGIVPSYELSTELTEARAHLAARVAELEAELAAAKEQMIERLMPAPDDEYPSCPLCDYDGIWNTTLGTDELKREAIRAMFDAARGAGPPPT